MAALSLAAAVGVGTFVYESWQLGNRCAETLRFGMELVRIEIDLLTERGIGTSANPPVQEALDRLMREPSHLPMGRFVFVAVSDASRRELAKSTDYAFPEAQILADALHVRGYRYPEENLVVGPVLDIAERPDIPFAAPIADRNGKTIGHINGVFVLSPSAETALFHVAWRAAGLAVFFVLITVLFIYPVILDLVKRLGDLAAGLLDANVDIVKVLGRAVEKRDSDTETHNYRVTLYAVMLAEAVGQDDSAMRNLIKGALLHDVGKIGIRDDILLKPGRLDAAEYTAMQKHVQLGLDILGGAAWLVGAMEVVACHHEKFDGKGYPNGLGGEDIPLNARIFSIADVFDALTSMRPYKQAFGLEQALAILHRGAGGDFDPHLVEVFARLVPSLYRTISDDDAACRKLLDEVAHHYYRDSLSEILVDMTADKPRTA